MGWLWARCLDRKRRRSGCGSEVREPARLLRAEWQVIITQLEAFALIISLDPKPLPSLPLARNEVRMLTWTC